MEGLTFVEILLIIFVWVKPSFFGSTCPPVTCARASKACGRSSTFVNTCFKWWGKGWSSGLGSRNSGLLILVLTLTFVTFGSSFYDSVSVPGLRFKKEST